MPSPEKKKDSSSINRENKPGCLTIPEPGSDQSSMSPSPIASILQTPDQDLTPSSPKFIDEDQEETDTCDEFKYDHEKEDEDDEEAEEEEEEKVTEKTKTDIEDDDECVDKDDVCDHKYGDEVVTDTEVDEGEKDGLNDVDIDEPDGKKYGNDSTPGTPKTKQKIPLLSLGKKTSSRRKGKCSKCAAENSSGKQKGWKLKGNQTNHKCKGTESHSEQKRKSSSRHSREESIPEGAMSPRTRELSDKRKRVPGSPRKSEHSRRSKQDQLKERHLERRVQQESGHKRLAKKESELKQGKELVVESDEEESEADECRRPHHHHHHRSPRRARSERRSSHRSRSSSISSRRNSELDSESFTVPNRWLSYDRLSQSSDCEHRSNGSMIHLEYPYKPSNNQGIYISPYFSAAYRAPGAEILIASLIMIVGVVALITYFATGMQIWQLVGGVCLGLGGMFMLLGFCWYCAISSQKQEEDAIQLKVKKFREMLRLERSPSDGLSQVKSEIQMV